MSRIKSVECMLLDAAVLVFAKLNNRVRFLVAAEGTCSWWHRHAVYIFRYHVTRGQIGKSQDV